MVDIFIVDDDSKFVEEFSKTLEEDFPPPEFRISSAKTVAQAQSTIFSFYDVLLIADIDFRQVGEQADEGLKLIDLAAHHRNAQVVLMTGYGHVEYAFEGAQRGAFGIFNKSADYEKRIRPLLKSALSNIRLTQRHRDALNDLRRHKEELARSGAALRFLFRALEFTLSILAASAVVLLLNGLITGSVWRVVLFVFVALSAAVFFERISRFVLKPKNGVEVWGKHEQE